MNFRQKLNETELAALAEPCLRMFFSVDVVGSTAFKEKAHQTDGRPWLNFLHGFYTGFPATFVSEVGKFATEHARTHDPDNAPLLWKALGDELIFTVPLTHNSHPCLYLCAFRRALIETIKYYTEGTSPLPISLKGTAWLAGFPVWNSAIPMEATEPLSSGSSALDFVGPLIDIGFRLTKFATPQRLIISADLAWLISSQRDFAGLSFYFLGGEELKGVLKGRPYPVFWIDCYPDRSVEGIMADYVKAEDRLLRRDKCNDEDILELTGSFLNSVSDSIPKPFISRAGQRNIPDGFSLKQEAVKAELRRIYQVDSDPGDASEETAAPKSKGALDEWVRADNSRDAEKRTPRPVRKTEANGQTPVKSKKRKS